MTDLHSDASAASRSAQLDRAIRHLLDQAPELEAAAVVSFDGLPMAAALPPSMDEDRVAAMSAALLSLGERAAQGLGRGDLSQVYIEGDNGTVFLVSADDEAVLVAVASKGAKAGMMLYEVRRAAAVVAAVLRADEPDPEPALRGLGVVPAVPATPEPAVQIPSQTSSAPAWSLAAPAHTPTYEVPLHDVPVRDVPVLESPAYDPPVRLAPHYDAPVYEAPRYEAPVYAAPTYEVPVHDTPIYDVPVYETPGYRAPADELPVYLAQQYAEPTPVEQAPVQTAGSPQPAWPAYAPTGSVMPGGGVPPSAWS